MDHDPELVELGASLSLFTVSVATLLGSGLSAGGFEANISKLVVDRERELEDAICRCGLAVPPLGARTLPDLVTLSKHLDVDVAAKFGHRGMAIYRLAVKFAEAQAHLAFSVPYKPDHPALVDLARRACLPPRLVLRWAKQPATALQKLRKYVTGATGATYYDRIRAAFLNRPLIAVVVIVLAVVAALLGLLATFKGLL
jgi:hypothetical protein